ncbi:NAD(P)-binding protein [Rhodoferax sp.]|uniref:NAD(P)-binding protein n=1 Tax=Rhodoferax sp. TaxID=50421 RepID=UPI00275D5996|nr:FAD-dependent oxidoreductase [Rhodoferax sp.]
MGQGAALISRRHFVVAAALPLAACQAPRQVAGGFVGTHAERGHLLRTPTAGRVPIAQRRTRVIIAGGGVAGLAAARALRLRGIDDFAVLELEDTSGGNSRAGSLGGMAHPLGAHYLPVPSEDAHEVQDLLEELGLRQRVAGRWTYDERHLCHSPQERLFFDGAWQEGLLPVQGVGPQTHAQYQQFAALVERARLAAKWSIPASRSPQSPFKQALSAITFVAHLEQNGLTDAHLRWYLDYCCRDDYGAGLATVSAWAGMHYFASRHGFRAPGGDGIEHDGVLTWPEGNGWLTRRLAAPLGERLRCRRVVVRIEVLKHGVEVDALDPDTGQLERWHAQRCIVALPLFVAARVVHGAPEVLSQRAAQMRYAPWLVANLQVEAPLHDRPGPAPSWDNVIYGAAGLGYVDAQHQSLKPVPGATVLTYYRALGDERDGRRQLLERPWASWRDEILTELSLAHPDLRGKTTRMDITRYGHAMAIPVPRATASASDAMVSIGRLNFAHGDWAGYSVFEEAFTQGHHAAWARAA